MIENRKQPIGIIPKKFWVETRIADLVAAIYRRAEYYNDDCLKQMTKELHELHESLRD